MTDSSHAEELRAATTLADLTDQHAGREVYIDDPTMPTAVRCVWIISVTEAKAGDHALIEIRDALANFPSVTRFRYPPETPCRVSRPYPQPRRRARRTRATA